MSVEAIALVLHHSRSEGTAKVVLLGIANHDGDGGAWPSIETLTKYANKSESAVHRAVARLVELGEVRVHANAGGTREQRADRRPNRYEILLRCPAECDGSKEHRLAVPADGVASARPRSPDGVASAPPRGRVGASDGVASALPEPPIEPSPEPSFPATASLGAGDPDVGTPEGARTRRARGELDALDAEADAVTRAWWESTDPRPSIPGDFAAARRRVREFRRRGWTGPELAAALPEWSSWTNGQLEQVLRRHRHAAEAREEVSERELLERYGTNPAGWPSHDREMIGRLRRALDRRQRRRTA